VVKARRIHRQQAGAGQQEQGQREAAVEEFVAANREDPDMSEAMFSAGYTLADIPERRQQAILYLQRFIEAYPETVGRRPVRPSVVDLRYPNGFAMRVAGEGKGK